MAEIQENLENEIQLGRKATAAKQWSEAFAIWKIVAELDPENIEGHYRAGQASFHIENLIKSEFYLKNTLQLDKNFLEAIRYLARIYHRNKNWIESKNYWQRLLSLDVEDYEANLRLGQALINSKDYLPALRPLELALSQRPGAQEALENYALALEGAGDLQKAYEIWQSVVDVVDQNPKNIALTRLLIKLGLDKRGSNGSASNYLVPTLSRTQFDNASSVFDLDGSGLSSFGVELDALLNSLRSTDKSRQWLECLNFANAILNIDENNFDANFAKAKSLFRLGRAFEAIVAIQKTLIRNPANDKAEILFKLISRKTSAGGEMLRQGFVPQEQMTIEMARELSKQKLWGESLLAWEDLLLEDPNLFEAYYRSAVSLFHLHRLDESQIYAKSAIKLRNDHVDSLVLVARVDHNMQRWDEAIGGWQAVLMIAPEFFEAHYRLGQIAYVQGRYADAQHLLEAAIQLRPGHTDCVNQLVNVLRRQSKIENALDIFDGLLKKDPNNIEIFLNRCIVLAELGQANEAITQLVNRVNEVSLNFRDLAQISRFFVKSERWAELVEILVPITKQENIETSEFYLEVLNNLALAYDRLDNFEHCLLVLEIVLGLDSSNELALVRRARVLRSFGRIDDALKMREALCRLYPLKAEHWSERIFLLGSLDRDVEIPRILAEAENCLAPTAMNFWQLSKGLEAAVLIPEAENYILKATTVDSAFYTRAAEFYWRIGNVPKAFEQASIARKIDPSNLSIVKILLQAMKTLELVGLSVNDLGSNHELLSPEILFTQLVKELSQEPRLYAPNPNGVVLLTGALAGGGAERQLVTTIRGLTKYIQGGQNIALFVQNLSSKLKRDFYLPYIANLPLDIVLLDPKQAIDILREQIPLADAELISLFPDDMAPSIAFWYFEFLKRKPAVIHAWQDMTCLTAVVAALLAGVPRILLSTRSMRPDNPRRRLKRFMQVAYQEVLKLPNVSMLNNSKAGARDYEDWLGLPSGSIDVIYNGIDFEALSQKADPAESARLRKEMSIPKSSLVVGGVFRMSEEKRPLLWVETAALVAKANPSLHFVIAGDGPMYEQVQAKANELGFGDRMHLPGHVNVSPWFLMMDALLLTSRMEGMPNVLLEAQYLGIPVVAPNVGGCPEVVDQGRTGWVVDGATAETLSERLNWMLANPDWMRKAGKRATIFAKAGFSIDTMIKRTLDMYCMPLFALGDQDEDFVVTTQTASELCKRASDLLANQNPQEALKVLQKAILAEPRNPSVWRISARASSRLGKRVEALEAWANVLGIVADDFEAIYRSGELRAAMGFDLAAVQDLKKALAIKSDHPGPLRALARLYTKQGLLQLALETWNYLLLIDPADGEALFSSGKILLQVRQNTKGEQRLLEAVVRGGSLESAQLLIKILSFSKRTDEAIEVAKKGLAGDPRNARWYKLLFDLYITLGYEDEINLSLKKLATSAVDSDVESLFYAQTLSAAERFDEASNVLTKIENTLSVRAQVIVLKMQIALQKADFESAQALYRVIGSEELKNRAIQSDIGKIQQALNDFEFFHQQFGEDGSKGEIDRSVSNAFFAAFEREIGRHKIESKKGTILHIVNSLAAGGTERQAVETAVAQKRSGLYKEVIVLRADPADAGRASFFIPRLQEAGVKTETLKEFLQNQSISSGVNIPLITEPSGAIAGYLGLPEIRQYLKAIEQIKPEVVHLWTPQCCARAGLASLLLGVPKIILRAGSVAPESRIGLLPGEKTQFEFFRKAYATLTSQKNVILVNNCLANLRNYIDWIGKDSNVKNAKVVHNGIDFNKFGDINPAAVEMLKRELDIPRNAQVVGSVIRFEKEKGVDLWLGIAKDLVRRNENLHFVLVGEGRLRNRILEEIKKNDLQDNIHLPGMVSDGIANYYGLMNLFLLTSHYEGLPNALIEAQWFGVPIVARNVGGVAETISSGVSGELVDSDLIDDYVTIIEKILKDRKLLEKMGKAGKEYAVENFSIQNMLLETQKLYQRS
jgi:glycosyltransferase involved in cell wall biosynthesis/Tfp pilus assembly protein PilF